MFQITSKTYYFISIYQEIILLIITEQWGHYFISNVKTLHYIFYEVLLAMNLTILGCYITRQVHDFQSLRYFFLYNKANVFCNKVRMSFHALYHNDFYYYDVRNI